MTTEQLKADLVAVYARAEKAEAERDEAVEMLRLFQEEGIFYGRLPEPVWERLDDLLASIDAAKGGE